MLRLTKGISAAALCVGLPVVLPGIAISQDLRGVGSFDIRMDGKEWVLPPSDQRAAIAKIAEQVPRLVVSYDGWTGVTRRLDSVAEFLTRRERGITRDESVVASAKSIALELGLEPSDFREYGHWSALDCSRHPARECASVRQWAFGMPVFEAVLTVHFNPSLRVSRVDNLFVPSVHESVNTLEAEITADEALELALANACLEPGELTLEPTDVELMWLPIRRGRTRLVWSFRVDQVRFLVDAVDGVVWYRRDPWSRSAASEPRRC